MATAARKAVSYSHPEATSLLRPDVGTQAQFRKKKPPRQYRYDTSLSPVLDFESCFDSTADSEMVLGGPRGR